MPLWWFNWMMMVHAVLELRRQFVGDLVNDEFRFGFLHFVSLRVVRAHKSDEAVPVLLEIRRELLIGFFRMGSVSST
jgi:hypothetical protein